MSARPWANGTYADQALPLLQRLKRATNERIAEELGWPYMRVAKATAALWKRQKVRRVPVTHSEGWHIVWEVV